MISLRRLALLPPLTVAATASLMGLAAAPAQAATTSATVTACKSAFEQVRPAWSRTAGWRVRCTTDADGWSYGLDTYNRVMEVNLYRASPRSLAAVVTKAHRSIPAAYRNNPYQDCLQVAKAEASFLKAHAPGWKIACVNRVATYKSEGLGSSTQRLMGVANFAKKQVSIYAPLQTLQDLKATTYHEEGHAISISWGRSAIRNWNTLSKSTWTANQSYERRGQEIWAESYANYRLKGTLDNPVTRIIAPATVQKQLAYAKTKAREAPAYSLW